MPPLTAENKEVVCDFARGSLLHLLRQTQILADDMEVPGKKFQTVQQCGRLLIRPELSPSQAITSLSNCLHLARSWTAADQVCFVLQPNSPRIAEKRIANAGFDYFRLQTASCVTKELSQLKNCVAKWQPTALILDGHHFADLNPSSFATFSTQVICLKHPEIAHRPEFYVQHHDDDHADKKIATHVRRVVVVLDDAGTGKAVLSAFSQIESPSFSIDICIDRGGLNDRELHEIASVHRHSVRIHKTIACIDDLLGKSDLGIVGFGTHCFDMAYHRVPMLAIQATHATPLLSRLLIDANAIAFADLASDQIGLAESIKSIVRDRERRQQLSNAARQLVDGRGAERITEFLNQNLAPLRKAS